MPQPRNTASKSTGSARSGAKGTTSSAKGTTSSAKRTTSSAAKRTTSSAKRTTSSAKRTTNSAANSAKRTTGATKRASGASASSAKRSTSSASSRARTEAKRASDGAGDLRLEAVAQRVRKLNERIIDAGKDAGETTLTAYEKALKAIASSLNRGASTSEVEWLSQLLSTQAKFIRDVTDTWTRTARGMLK
jgi:hypothetical protein